MPRIKPEAAGSEARMLPLCFAAVGPTFKLEDVLYFQGMQLLCYYLILLLFVCSKMILLRSENLFSGQRGRSDYAGRQRRR